MNYSGKSPLKMRCPHCETYAAHPVIRTEGKVYHWGKATIPLFQRIAGRDISFRRRLKRCTNCQASFLSIEMANLFRERLINEVQQIEGRLVASEFLLKRKTAKLEALEAEQKETHKAIRQASKSLNRRLPKRKKS